MKRRKLLHPRKRLNTNALRLSPLTTSEIDALKSQLQRPVVRDKSPPPTPTTPQRPSLTIELRENLLDLLCELGRTPFLHQRKSKRVGWDHVVQYLQMILPSAHLAPGRDRYRERFDKSTPFKFDTTVQAVFRQNPILQDILRAVLRERPASASLLIIYPKSLLVYAYRKFRQLNIHKTTFENTVEILQLVDFAIECILACRNLLKFSKQEEIVISSQKLRVLLPQVNTELKLDILHSLVITFVLERKVDLAKVYRRCLLEAPSELELIFCSH